MIRDSRIHQIDQVIQTSAAEGMISMDESILRLYKAGRIAAETALRCAMIPEQLAYGTVNNRVRTTQQIDRREEQI